MTLHSLLSKDVKHEAAERHGRHGLPFFPWHYEDEHLYSVVARHKRYTQNYQFQLRDDLFGSPKYAMSLEAPNSIGGFCSAVGFGELSNVDYVVRNLTPFNYTAAYTGVEERTSIFRSMVCKGAPGNINRLRRGLLVPVLRGLRYCPSCFQEDLENYPVGELYWRRSHQLPSVVVCTRHHIPLLATGWAANYGPTNFIIPAADLIDSRDVSALQTTIDDAAMTILHELAVKSEFVLTDRFVAQSPAVALEGYRAQIRHIGLMRGRRLDTTALAISFKDSMGPIQQVFPFLFASDGYPSWWLRDFLAGGKSLKRPLLNLLVEEWLSRATPLREGDGRLVSLRATRATTKGRGSMAEMQKRRSDDFSAGQVADIAQRIMSMIPLVRVTRAKLACELGISNLRQIAYAEEYRPRTLEAIKAVEESHDAFFERRLNYQIERAAAEGIEPRFHLILKRLGIRKRYEEVAQGIAAWKSRSGSNQ